MHVAFNSPETDEAANVVLHAAEKDVCMPLAPDVVVTNKSRWTAPVYGGFDVRLSVLQAAIL